MSTLRRIHVGIAKWFLSLIPATPPAWDTDRKPLERSNMEYLDECGPDGFISFFPKLSVNGKRVLDYGCGYGGRTVRYAELGASISGTEIVPSMVEDAREFAARKSVVTDIHLVDDLHLPFKDNTFDVVISYDVFEHVRDLDASLRECVRVMRPGGTLYAILPPFYHPFGGSHMHGYVSCTPGPNVLFPCSILSQAAEEIMRSRGQPLPATPLDPPSYPLWSVNGTSIRGFERMLRRIPKSRAVVKYLPFIYPNRYKWQSWQHGVLAWPLRIPVGIPLLREISVRRIQLELTK